MTICLVPELALQRRSEPGFRGVILAFVSASRHYVEISCEDRMQLVPERPDTKLTGDVLPQGRGGSKSQELGRGLGGARRMAKVRVGLIGCGFAAELHMHGYRRVYGVDARVTAVAARGDHVVDFAERHRIPTTYRDFRALLADDAIDVVDICTPPVLHAEMIVAAVEAGKHVICEKPLTGYFGRDGDASPIGSRVAKARMYERVMEQMEATCAAVQASGRLFLYAEDWIYAPAVAKTAEILAATGDKILFMKADESHSGSHAAHAAQWAMTGGGSLIRMGCHPLSTVLYLKQVEARARGERIAVVSVTADVGSVAKNLTREERRFIQADPLDVEDWAMLTLTFSDATKSTIFAGDMIVGGVRNLVETYIGGGALFA